MIRPFKICLFYCFFSSLGFGNDNPLIHIIKKGDNLWNLSDQYLNNPFKWKNIWNNNPYITNPHLIYPGNSLSINSLSINSISNAHKTNKETTRIKIPDLDYHEKFTHFSKFLVRNRIPPVYTGDKNKKINFKQKLSRNLNADIIFQAPTVENFISLKNHFPKISQIELIDKNNRLLMVYDKFSISKGTRDGVKIDDLFQVIKTGKNIKKHKTKRKLGKLIHTLGHAKVISVKPNKSILLVTKVYGKMYNALSAIPIQKIKKIPIHNVISSSEIKSKGRVVYLKSTQLKLNPYSYAVIDEGLRGGVKLGDNVTFFDKGKKKNSMSENIIGSGIVIKISNTTSTVFATNILPGSLNKGDYSVSY